MASYQQTTSVALRRGNHAENMAFTGTQGEITADLGVSGEGTDVETTLRLHNGINAGGIAVARADLTNTTTAALAKNRNLLGDKNLAYADLSNLETLSDPSLIEKVVMTLDEYGMATDEEIEDIAATKANVTMSNINTNVLAEATPGAIDSHAGKNLAYYDMSNVNTKYLATTVTRSSDPEDLPLAYYDQQNVDTTNLTLDSGDRPITMTGPTLAKKDLTNVENTAFNDVFFGSQRNFLLETTKDRLQVLSDDSGSNDTYASTGAIVNYVKDKVDSIEFLNQDFSNALDWNALYEDKSVTSKIVFESILENGGSGYSLGYHPLPLIDENPIPEVKIQLLINAINAVNEPTDVTIIPAFGDYDLGGITSLTFKTENNDTVTVNLNIDQYEGYCGYRATVNSTYITSDGFNVGGLYECTTNTTTVPFNAIVITNVDSNGVIIDYKMAEYNHTYMLESETLSNIDHLLSETGNIATITVNSRDVMPAIGGAGLLKKDLTNLEGMTSEDIAACAEHEFYVNPEANLPSFYEPVSAKEYGHIVTAGKLVEAMNTQSTRAIYRVWS